MVDTSILAQKESMPDRPITNEEYESSVRWVAANKGRGVTTDTMEGGRGFVVGGEPLILVSMVTKSDGGQPIRVGRLIASPDLHNQMVLDGVIGPLSKVKGKQ